MNPKTLNHVQRKIAAAVSITLALAMSSMAADVYMTSGDGFGDHSFDSGQHWSDGKAPSGANNYFSSNSIVRTLDNTNSGTTFSFQGGSLTINPGGAVYMKINDGVVDFPTVVTNMGRLVDAFAPGAIVTFKGNMVVPLLMSTNVTGTAPSVTDTNSSYVTSRGGGFDTQSGNQGSTTDTRWITNDMTMTGDGYLTNYSAGTTPPVPTPPGYVIYTGNGTGFYGSVVIASNTLVSALSEDNLFGNPPSFRRDSLLMDGGVFQFYDPTNPPSTNFIFDRANGGIWISANNGQFDIPPGCVLTNAMSLGGPGTLTLTNTGTFVCTGNATNFTGELVVNIGTLILGTANALTGPNTISVGPGGTFNATAAGMVLGSGQTLVGNGSISGTVSAGTGSTISPGGDGIPANFGVSGLTLSGGAALHYDFSVTTNDVINVSGSLSVSGTTTIKLNSLPKTSGTYTLMTVAGAMGGSPANFTVQTLTTRGTTTSLSYDTASTPKRLLLNITVAPPANLVWNGNVNSTWDLANTPNWLNGGSSDVYYDLDNVNFTDVGAAVQPTLNTTVNPGAVNFNSSSDYTLSGSGAIAGPVTLSKGGTGTTTIATTNTYSGGTIITNGVLQIGAIGGTNPVVRALGNPSGALATVADNGTLDLNGAALDSAYTAPVEISGTGAGGQGAIANAVGGFTSGSGDIGIGTVELTGNATVSAASNWQIGNTGSGIIGNGYTLTKTGTNYLYLRSAAASPLGGLVIAGGGVLFYDHADAVGKFTPITLTGGGFIDTWNPANNFSGLTFYDPIIVNGGGAILNFRPVTFNRPPYDVYNGNVSLMAGSLVISNVNTYTGPTFGHVTINGDISGPGGIAAIGSLAGITGISYAYGGNQVNLNGVNSYTGPTTIELSAYVNTTTASQGGGSYTITNAGALDVAVVPGHTTMPMSSLTLVDGPAYYGSSISFARLAQMPTAPVIYATNLTISSPYFDVNTIFPPSGGYTIGQFPLIKYNGSIGGDGFSLGNTIQLATLPGGVSATLVNNTANHTIDLSVTAAGKQWTGNANSDWDTSSANWKNQAGSAVSFADGDAVTFGDTATSYNVDVTRSNTVAGIMVNSTHDYYWTNEPGGTLAGSGVLTKLGSGTLTIACTNDTFTGGTYIYGGTIKLADKSFGYPYGGGALNNNLGSVYVANGGTLDINGVAVPNYQGFGPDGYNVFLSGSGVGGNGALINSNTTNNDNADPGYVTLIGSATVGGPGDINIRHGVAPQLTSQDGAYTLTKVGSGKFRIRYVAIVSTNFGTINILGGVVSYESSSTLGLGDPSKSILVGSGAGFGWGTPSAPCVRPLVCSNNSTLYGYDIPTNVINSLVTLNSGNVTLSGVLYTNGVVQDSYHGLIFSNVISGGASVTVDQRSLITFAAANTYNGNTVISSTVTNNGAYQGSVLSLVGNGSINNSPNIILQGTDTNGTFAASLDASGRTDGTLTLVSGQTLRGDDGSSVSGNVAANIGATITPGGSGNIQYMTFSNNLVLSSGSTVAMDVSMDGGATNDVINVGGMNNYAGTLQLANSGTTPLAAGDSFKLFNNAQYSGNFTTISGSPGAGLEWSFNPATGVASVVKVGPVSGPPIYSSVAGNQLTLSWSTNGFTNSFTLQAQTNTLAKGLWTNWVDVAGSSSLTQKVMTINSTNATVFYRLIGQ